MNMTLVYSSKITILTLLHNYKIANATPLYLSDTMLPSKITKLIPLSSYKSTKQWHSDLY